jgi:hypothetical protein
LDIQVQKKRKAEKKLEKKCRRESRNGGKDLERGQDRSKEHACWLCFVEALCSDMEKQGLTKLEKGGTTYSVKTLIRNSRPELGVWPYLWIFKVLTSNLD